MPALTGLEFPDLLRFCRELMGLKQYACSGYLGMERPRYKKLELGQFSKPIKNWEMNRLQTFFKLPGDMLQSKQKDFLINGRRDHMERGKNVWNRQETTTRGFE